MNAGLGRMSLLYYVEPVTGFMLIDSLFSDEPRRLLLRRANT